VFDSIGTFVGVALLLMAGVLFENAMSAEFGFYPRAGDRCKTVGDCLELSQKEGARLTLERRWIPLEIVWERRNGV
jgi:hypothetical protein